MSTSVIIPAINEEESLGQVLLEIDKGQIDEIILVDGGSTDDTVAKAETGRAHVVHEARRGYGRACAAGVTHANGDILVFMDADGADDPTQIQVLVAPRSIQRGERNQTRWSANRVAYWMYHFFNNSVKSSM